MGRLNRLLAGFGNRYLSEINGALCRAYAEERNSGGARRELEDLRAAIGHYHKEGLCREVPRVWLPPHPPPRERWLSRSEAARLLWAAWRFRGIQFGRPCFLSRQHVARFILVALYTGTRSGAICGSAFSRSPNFGWIDTERGLFHRRPARRAETKKRQPPIPLPNRLLAHLRRWERRGDLSPVSFNGRPIGRMNTAFRRVALDAGLPDVTPHTLRHTAATWLMQAGVDPWAAAGYLGMSLITLTRTYGHHHPDHLKSARDAIGRRPNRHRSSNS
jgi:integrase